MVWRRLHFIHCPLSPSFLYEVDHDGRNRGDGSLSTQTAVAMQEKIENPIPDDIRSRSSPEVSKLTRDVGEGRATESAITFCLGQMSQQNWSEHCFSAASSVALLPQYHPALNLL